MERHYFIGEGPEAKELSWQPTTTKSIRSQPPGSES